MVRFRKFRNFRIFWNFSQEISVQFCPRFENFEIFGRMVSAPLCPVAGSLLTPIRTSQMPLLNHRYRRRARRFNRLLSKRRVKIEYDFKEMKTYKVIGDLAAPTLAHACVRGVSYSFIWKNSETLQNSLSDTAKSNFNSFPQMCTRSIYVLNCL